MGNFCRDLCEGVIGNCRNCMSTPITRSKIYWFSGIMVVIILIIIIICVSVPSGGPSSSGSDALSKGLASGFFYLEPDIGDSKTVDGFDKKIFDSLAQNKIRLQVFGAQTKCEAQNKDAVALSVDQVEFLGRLLQNVSILSLAKSADDVQRAFGNGKISSMISVVGGHAIDNRLALLRVYYLLGVRVMTVVADGCSTLWGKAANDNSTGKVNFDPFGKAVIKEMNRLGILIDIAGADKDTQSAILDASTAPVAAIGVGLKATNQNPLNLDSNEIVTKFAKNKGILMISTDCALIAADQKNCTRDDFTSILQKAKSYNINVGIGGSLNSTANSQVNLEGWEKYFNELYDSKGFSLDYLRGLAKDNFINVLREVEKVSKDLQKAPVGETFFNWTQIPKDKNACYTYTPTPPTPSPTPAPTPAPSPAPGPAPGPAPTPAPGPAPTPAPTPSSTPAPDPKPPKQQSVNPPEASPLVANLRAANLRIANLRAAIPPSSNPAGPIPPAPQPPAPGPAPGPTPAIAPGPSPAPAPGPSPAIVSGPSPAPVPGPSPAIASGPSPAPAPGPAPAP